MGTMSDKGLHALLCMGGLGILGLALFEHFLKRGYLQSTRGRSLGSPAVMRGYTQARS
jgi:hypothetical protein